VKFVIWLLTNAAALAVAAWALDGISFEGADWQEKLVPLLIVAAILGFVNGFVGFVLKILSIPFIIVTLGLFLLVINAWMLMLTGWIADTLSIGFEVDGFWTAVLGSIIITLVTWMIQLTVMDD
jgi:putative membrane protein